MLKMLVALAAVAFVTPCLAAGPFGFEPTMRLADVEKLGPVKKRGTGSFFYESETAPKPHPKFESFFLLFSPSSKLLVKVGGIGTTIQTNVYGFELQSAFEDVEAALVEKYGKGKRTDALLPGSIWKDLGDWMMALNKKERRLSHLWTRSNGDTLPEGVDTIALKANALSSESGYLDLMVEFMGFEAAAKEMDEAENDAL
jgi:hypothetical protein